MSMTIRQIHIEQLSDDAADLSYLDANDPRRTAYNDGYWSMVGIRAMAEIMPENGYETVQRIYSGGLWGIESDSDPEYLETIAREQVSDLADILHELGIGASEIFLAAEQAGYPLALNEANEAS